MINSTKIKKLPVFSERPTLDKKICLVDLPEVVREGTGVSPGIVIGRVFIYDSFLKSVPRYHIPEKKIDAEQQRFMTAVHDTLAQFDTILDRAKDALEGDPLSSLFDVYRHMLKGSRLMRGVCNRIRNNRINAESAVQAEVSAIADVFNAMDDLYISARIEDIRSVGVRIIRNLQSESDENTLNLPENAVILSKDLSAADTALLNLKKISAFVTTAGSNQSHAALLARSMGMPAVVGLPDILNVARTGDIIIIDGTYGKVILCPTQANVDLYRKYRSDFLRWRRSLKRLRDQPCLTTDNVFVSLKGNIDLPNETDFLLQTGIDGIGLMRSEYMFLNRGNLPDETEQFETLKKITSCLDGRPLTFRTLDVGADKAPPVLNIPKTENPALGLRGIRYTFSTPDLLETQFRALLKASSSADIRILLPMISSPDEMIRARRLLEKCAQDLRTEGFPLPPHLPPLGAMIETPAAALETDVLAYYCDFFSIGTNDLIQYTLAVGRTDTTVSDLFNPLHPAVIKLIKATIDNANAKGIPVSVCGDMAANHRYAALLIGLGVRELSMPAINIPMVKERIRSLSLSEMENFARHVLSLTLPAEVTEAFNTFEEGYRF